MSEMKNIYIFLCLLLLSNSVYAFDIKFGKSVDDEIVVTSIFGYEIGASWSDQQIEEIPCVFWEYPQRMIIPAKKGLGITYQEEIISPYTELWECRVMGRATTLLHLPLGFDSYRFTLSTDRRLSQHVYAEKQFLSHEECVESGRTLASKLETEHTLQLNSETSTVVARDAQFTHWWSGKRYTLGDKEMHYLPIQFQCSEQDRGGRSQFVIGTNSVIIPVTL